MKHPCIVTASHYLELFQTLATHGVERSRKVGYRRGFVFCEVDLEPSQRLAMRSLRGINVIGNAKDYHASST